MTSGRALSRAGAVALALLISTGLAFAQPKREAPTQPQSASGGLAAGAGLVVTAVESLSPAEKAGILRGDVLLKADKIELSVPGDLGFYVSRLKVGDTIQLELTSGGAAKSVSVTLGERSKQPYLGVVVQGAARGPRLELQPAPDGLGGATPRGMRGQLLDTISVEALVQEVVGASPAETAGIKPGDSILSVDGTALRMAESLTVLIGAHKPGDKVTLALRSQDGQSATVEVTLAGSAADATKAFLGVSYREVPLFAEGWGLRQGNQQPGWVPFDGRAGVLVRGVAAGSPAEQAGIKAGDVITRVGQDKVSGAGSLGELVARHSPGEKVEIGLAARDGGAERSVTVTLAARQDDASKAYLGVMEGRGFRGGMDGGRLTPPSEGRSGT